MDNDCLIPASAKNCGEATACGTCGFNPEVCRKRKANIRNQHKVKPPKPPQLLNFNDALATVKGRLEYAEKRLDEETRNGEDYDVRYWAAYRDGVKSVLEALEESL